VFQPFLVSLSDIFGRRQSLFMSVLFFTVGTIICCVASNFVHLLAGRSIQGIGGGGSLSIGLVIMTDIVPLRQRPTYNGIIQIAWAVGTSTGPLIGGLFADHSTVSPRSDEPEIVCILINIHGISGDGFSTSTSLSA
jgi:MFS family permease